MNKKVKYKIITEEVDKIKMQLEGNIEGRTENELEKEMQRDGQGEENWK